MFKITITSLVQRSEYTIYSTTQNDGFYNLKIHEKVNDYGKMTFSCLMSQVNFEIGDIITVYKDEAVYWQGLIVSMSRGFYGNVNVTAYGMMYTLTYQLITPRRWLNKTVGSVMIDIQDLNNTDFGSGLTINPDFKFNVAYDGTSYQDPVSYFTADGDVLETLRQMCKVGAAPRVFEVYSSLSSTQAAHIKELSLLNKVITDYQVQESKEKIAHENMEQKERLIALRADQAAAGGGDVYNIQNNNLTVTSSQLLDMIEQADKSAHEVEDNINPEFNLE
jgi:hypothetical protein